jgi:DMSO reductase family type II enzyme chaperone
MNARNDNPQGWAAPNPPPEGDLETWGGPAFPSQRSELTASAAERSAAYRLLAQGFTYAGAQQAPFHIAGPAYNDAFDPSVCEAGASLREGLYTEADQSSVFEELMRFYTFFGLARADDAEMPDHLSVELEFMHYLTHLESDPTLTDEARDSLQRAQRDFLGRHLSRLVQGVANALHTEDEQCRQLVADCANFIEAELAYTQSLVND